MPERIQLSRRPGWRLPENTVAVTRPGRWGNPFVVGAPVDLRQVNRWGWVLKDKRFVAPTAEAAVRRFAHCLLWDDFSWGEVQKQLKGRNLACWCDPEGVCHGDVLLRVAAALPDDLRQLQVTIDDHIRRDVERAIHRFAPKPKPSRKGGRARA